jgi:protein TonB
VTVDVRREDQSVSTIAKKTNRRARSVLALAFFVTLPLGQAFADPTPVKREAPAYPRSAEARGIEGSVTLKFGVDAAGNVVSPQVVEGTPPGVFDAAAIDALSKWKYAPGAAANDMQIKLSFKLN